MPEPTTPATADPHHTTCCQNCAFWEYDEEVSDVLMWDVGHCHAHRTDNMKRTADVAPLTGRGFACDRFELPTPEQSPSILSLIAWMDQLCVGTVVTATDKQHLERVRMLLQEREAHE